MNSQAELLLSGHRLARNALWSFAGLVVPLLVAVLAVPYLIHTMGKERFGLLALIWMGIGYFSLFDMGLGRALTKLVAEHLGREDHESLQELIWTSLWLMICMGAIAMCGMLAISPYLISNLLNVPTEIRAEGVEAFRVLALGLPIVILTAAFVGILEAHHRFASIAVIRALLGTLTFLVPVTTLHFSGSLVTTTAMLLIVRVIAFILYFLLARNSRPELSRPIRPRRAWLNPLFSFGGWLTVSNIVGPVMVYFDRFFIASILNLSAVTYYVTPFEVLSRIFIVPQAVMSVLFPALATAFVADKDRMVALYSKASRILLLVVLPPAAVIFLLAPEGLALWLGEEFRSNSTIVVHWLALGVVINTIARVPFVALQSTGRPDIIAKIHIAELFPYLGVLWTLTREYGVAGTAAAWTLRIIVDTVLMLWMVNSAIPEVRNVSVRTLLTIPIFVGGFFAATRVESFSARGLIAIAVCIGCTICLWRSNLRIAIRFQD